MYFDSNQINSILVCCKCEVNLDEPRLLPCGNSICLVCASSIVLNEKEYQCLVCDDKHKMPKRGLPINKALVELLSFELIQVSRGKEFETLKETLRKIQGEKNKFHLLLNESDNLIKEHCIDLRGQVQLATEQAILNVNVSNIEFIDKIDEYEKDLICLNNKNLDRLKCFDVIEQELESFNLKAEEYLKKHCLNDNEIVKLNKDGIILTEKAELKIKKLENIIFSRRLMKFDTKIVTSLGELNVMECINSSVLKEELVALCEFSLYDQWNLIYQASQDGFEAADFHSKCDNKSNTLVVIKSENGNVFGGYTEQSWVSFPYNGNKSDPNAFIFSLINKQNRQLKIKSSSSQSIHCNSNWGPIFGGSHRYGDIVISNKSNTNKDSVSHLGRFYMHPEYAYQSNIAESFLAGTNKFEVIEIQVYTKIN